MKLFYAFPEPLPLPRARGVQVAFSITSLAKAGVAVELAYVPVDKQHPLGAAAPGTDVRLTPISRSWPVPLDRLPPFSRWHSVRWFHSRLQQAMATSAPDAIYVRHLKLADLLLRAGKSIPPLIYEAHEVFFDTVADTKRGKVLATEKNVVKGAAAVVCNSEATAARLLALYGPIGRLLVLPNGVTRPIALPEKPWHECQKHIIYAGSFFGWKGVDDLVAAAEKLDGFHITLVGGDVAQLERLRVRLPNQGARISLMPRLPHAEVMSLLTSACIAVLPNRPDPDSAFTSPIKLFEYMAAGCAVVAADLPSIREILDPSDAYWFRAGDPEDLAMRLKDAARSSVDAEAQGARLREKSRLYSWDARSERLREFLTQVIGKIN